MPAWCKARTIDLNSSITASGCADGGIYADETLFARIYKREFGQKYLAEASKYSEDVIACTRDICEYIYNTYGRYPAHVEAIHVPGFWLQVHHVEESYYEQYFRNGLTDVHRSHDHTWHAEH
jgi:hypothetical protein